MWWKSNAFEKKNLCMDEFRICLCKSKAFFLFSSLYFGEVIRYFYLFWLIFWKILAWRFPKKLNLDSDIARWMAPSFFSALFRSRIHIHCVDTSKAFARYCHVYIYCSISIIKFNLVHFCTSFPSSFLYLGSPYFRARR